MKTYRYVGHSMSDAAHGTYRTREEVEEFRQRDPIRLLSDALRKADLLDEAALEALVAEVASEVEDATTFAEDSPDPDLRELHTDVYAEPR
jgi:pyruvate dehydrogenase E1 component alpha subunit